MRTFQFSDAQKMSKWACRFIIHEIENKPDLLICPAVGNTPIVTYQELIKKLSKQKELSSSIRFVQLDEWLGFPQSAEVSCLSYLKTNLLKPLKVKNDRFLGFQTDVPDLESECTRMSEALETAGGIDLCILNMGVNGNIGFVEPAPALLPHAHISLLAQSTRNHSMVADLKEVPERGITLGMADILKSKKIILMVSGKAKRSAVKQLMKGEIRTDFPASFLRLHPQVFYAFDNDARA